MGKIVGNYRYDAKDTRSSAATKTFVGVEVGRGRIAEITFASVVDYTSTNTKLILGIRDAGGADHYLRVVQGAAVRDLSMEGKIYLLPGEKPIAIVEDPGAADVLYCSFHGIVYEMT
jgi:hypothetical protein